MNKKTARSSQLPRRKARNVGATRSSTTIPERAGVDPNFMTSFARGLSVLQAFSRSKHQLTISQVSAQTGISRAAVRRCFYTLTKLGFAGSRDGRMFFLEPRVLVLSNAFVSSTRLATVAQPIIERLSDEIHESCAVATLDKDEIIFVARTRTRHILSADLNVGTIIPTFCSSSGRVLLAELPDEELEAHLNGITFRRYTPRTVNSVDKLKQALRAAKRNGYAIIDQEVEIGLRSIAVPIRTPSGQAVAALVMGAYVQRASLQTLQAKILPRLLQVSREIGSLV